MSTSKDPRRAEPSDQAQRNFRDPESTIQKRRRNYVRATTPKCAKMAGGHVADITDLVRPLRLGFGALLISAGPLLLLIFLSPPLSSALPLSRSQLLEAPLWVLAALALALLWRVIYSPIALAVAGMSGSLLSTLNPLVGVDCIRAMGSIYWQAMAIYTVLVVTKWMLGLGFALIPLLGSLFKAFVDVYALLCVGCTLGYAMFKKAPELGIE